MSDVAVHRVFGALADPTRWGVLEILSDVGEGSATAIAKRLPVSRAAVIKHLNVLDGVGLVQSRKAGREVRYSVRAAPLRATAAEMDRIAVEWDTRLAALKKLAEDLAN